MRAATRTPHPSPPDPRLPRRLRRLAVVIGVAALLAVVAVPAGAIPPRPDDGPPIEDAPPVVDGPVGDDPRQDPSDVVDEPIVVEPASGPAPSGSAIPGGIPEGDLPEFEPIDVLPPPNADLTLLVDALVIEHRSVSARVVLPGNLRPTSPVDVYVAFGSGAATVQAYGTSASDLVFSHTFPSGGTARDELVTYWFVQHTPAGDVTYGRQQFIRIEPLYDVLVTPLVFRLDDDCDPVGESEITMVWSRPDGSGSRSDRSMSGGDVEQIDSFGGLWQEASPATDLREPNLLWREDDGGFGALLIAQRSDARILPGVSRTVVHYNVAAHNDNFCTAKIRYTVLLTLRTYWVL